MFKTIFSASVVAIIIGFVLSIGACQKESTSAVTTQPVVVGYLMPGQPISIKVYQQKGLTDTANYGALIGGLNLQVSDGSKTIALTETATGTYTHADDRFLIAGKTYSLQFTYNGSTVSASTVMPAKPVNYRASKQLINIPFRTRGGNPLTGNTDSVAVKFTWNNPDSLYHVLVFKNDDTSPASADLNTGRPVNFTLNMKQTANYDMYYRSFNYLGTYRAILYRVNKEYDDFLTTNTNTSSQKLTNPPTNVTNGFGIFTGMQADTITLKLTQY